MKEQLDEYLKEQRKKSFYDSDQLSIGEIIERLEACGTKWMDNQDKTVRYDFGTAVPTSLGSWRGVYSELALGYDLTGYDNNDSNYEDYTVESLLEELKSGIGNTYHGWKGGDYTMNEDTPVWVANEGNVGSTIIIDVIDNGYEVILLTGYRES